jgi:hypothetical protein
MKDTFLCPGLVVKMDGKTGQHLVILYCWSSSCDVFNPKTGNQFSVSTSTIRSRGTLVGSNFKRKGND